MRYVYFKQLKIVNFLSVGKKPVEITFKPGLNIITGKNYDKADRANGVGKSTIADAVHFALYGTTIRELKKENIVNDQAPDALCEVELDFAFHENDVVNECKIVRTINPAKCVFYINGEDVTRSGMPQTTELIANTIKTSSEVFQNSVIMTINNTVPFMAQKKVEKRKFIEGILGLEVFSNMMLQARSDYNDTKKSVDIQLAKMQEVTRNLQEANKQKDLYEDSKAKRIEVLNTRHLNNDNELKLLNEKISKLEAVDVVTEKKISDILVSLKSEKKQIETLNTKHSKLVGEAQMNIKFNTDRLKKIKKIDNKCPKCGHDLAEKANAQYDSDKTECENEIVKYKAQEADNAPKILECGKKLGEIDKGIVTAEKKLNDLAIRRKEVESINTHKQQLETWQQQIQVDIEALNKEANHYYEAIVNITERQKEITNALGDLEITLDVIENAKYITSEEGVKSFIVKKILQVLNNRLALYLKRLESNSMISFNEFFEENVTNERAVPCSYFNFSGAERKAIDLAMLFTFQDIRRAQADVWINLSIFDELFDTSLDEKGIELVLDILRERVDMYNESIYIISHRKESKKYCVGGEIVFLEKKNGITTRTTNYDVS